MEIPSMKTLIIYNYDGKEKRVLCDFIKKGDDKFASIDYNNEIESRNPFEVNKKYTYINTYEVATNVFTIEYQHDMEVADEIYAKVFTVLEFNSRIFKLEETNYDMKEYEDYDY